MKIISTPDPRLRKKSTKVKFVTDEVRGIVDEMVKASLEWEKEHPYELSAAMAAPQLGINKRIIVVRDDLDDKENNTFTALIDPEVIQTSGKTVRDYEGCLSVPKIYGMVGRPAKCKVKAKTLDGQEVRIKADGIIARTLMHEIDHLDGILFIDHIKGDENAFYQMNEKGDLVPMEYEKVAGNKDLFPDE